MLHHTMLAEWTKLRTTASFWWTTGLLLAVALGWSVLTTRSMVLITGELGGEMLLPFAPTVTPEVVISGFTGVGILVIMIQAVMTVTTEYRYGLPSINFLATPRRGQVALAKALLYALLAAGLSFLAVTGAYLAAMLMLAGQFPGSFTPFSDPEGQRLLWAVPLTMGLLVFFCQGVGLLVRQSAGAIFVLLIGYLVVESAARIIPRWGEDLYTVLPFVNMTAGMQDVPVYGAEWGAGVSLLIFAVWAVVVWLLGVVTLRRRDV